MFFSATYSQEIMDFAEHIVPNPVIIRLKREEESLDNIGQYYVRCNSPEDKYNAITNIYGTLGIGQAIIFCHVSLVFDLALEGKFSGYRRELLPRGWRKKCQKTVTLLPF